MSTTKTWINWIALFALLILFGIGAALWPAISANFNFSGGSSSTQVPVETRPIVLAIPQTVLPNGTEVGGQTFVLDPFAVIIGLTVFVFGAIVVTGFLITLMYTFLDKLRDKTVDSSEFAEHQVALGNKEKEYFKEVRQGRDPHPPPSDPGMPRWSAVSTSVIIIIFVALTGMVISLTLWPQWTKVEGNELLTPGLALIGVLCLITAIILVWRMSPQRIEKADASDGQGIPRDTLVVILTGVLILGLGIGFTIYINLP